MLSRNEADIVSPEHLEKPVHSKCHEDYGMCRSCHKNPAALYVSRYGVYLQHLCVRCWRKGAPMAQDMDTFGRGHIVPRSARS